MPTVTLPERTDWRDYAACAGQDPELFFPIGTGPRADAQVDEAKTICARCPVTTQCTRFASDHGYQGVWGGLDEPERRRLRARDRRPTDPREPSARRSA